MDVNSLPMSGINYVIVKELNIITIMFSVSMHVVSYSHCVFFLVSYYIRIVLHLPVNIVLKLNNFLCT